MKAHKMVVLEERRQNGLLEKYRIHVVTIPEKGSYVQLTSYNAFHRHETSRILAADKKKETLDFEFDRRSTLEKWEPHQMKPDGLYFDEGGLPRMEHADLWAFYEAIGWDYKKKRYV